MVEVKSVEVSKAQENFSVTLPISKAKLVLRIATGKDEAHVNSTHQINQKDTASYIANRRALLAMCVVSIGEKKGPLTTDDLDLLPLRDRSMAEMFFNSINEPADQDEDAIKKALNPFFGS